MNQKALLKIFTVLILFFFSTNCFAQNEIREEQEKAVESYELYVSILNAFIKSAKESGKDTTEIEAELLDYEELIEELHYIFSTGDLNMFNSKITEVQNATVALKEKMNKIGFMNDNPDENKSWRVEKLVQSFELLNNLYQPFIENAKTKGKNVSKARELLESMKKKTHITKTLLEDENVNGAYLELVKSYANWDNLYKEMKKIGFFDEERDKKAEIIEKAIEDFNYTLKLLEVVLDDAADEGKDIEHAWELFDALKAQLGEMKTLFEKNFVAEAWEKYLNIYVYSKILQREMKKIKVEEDDRNLKQKVLDAINLFKQGKSSIQFVLSEAKEKEIETEKAQQLLDTIGFHIKNAERLSEEEKFEEAWKEVLQAFEVSTEFKFSYNQIQQQLFKLKVIEKRIRRILKEFTSSFELIEKILDEKEVKGKNVGKPRSVLNQIRFFINDANSDFLNLRYDSAWKKMQSVFVQSKRLEKEFKKFKLKHEFIDRIISETPKRLENAQIKINEIHASGKKTKYLQEIFDSIKEKLENAKTFYQKAKFFDASREIQEAFILGKRFEVLSEKIFESEKNE